MGVRDPQAEPQCRRAGGARCRWSGAGRRLHLGALRATDARRPARRRRGTLNRAEPRREFPALFTCTLTAFVVLFVYLGMRQLLGLRIGSNSGTYLQSALSFLHHFNTNNLSDHMAETAPHDQWMLIALCPFVAIWPHLETVVIVQVGAVAFSAAVLRSLVRALG